MKKDILNLHIKILKELYKERIDSLVFNLIEDLKPLSTVDSAEIRTHYDKINNSIDECIDYLKLLLKDDESNRT